MFSALAQHVAVKRLWTHAQGTQSAISIHLWMSSCEALRIQSTYSSFMSKLLADVNITKAVIANFILYNMPHLMSRGVSQSLGSF